MTYKEKELESLRDYVGCSHKLTSKNSITVRRWFSPPRTLDDLVLYEGALPYDHVDLNVCKNCINRIKNNESKTLSSL